MKYDVVQGATTDELIAAVELAFADGWKCQGGVTVTVGDDVPGQVIFHQAMIKQDE